MIKYKNNINVGTGSVGYDADATSAAPADSVSGGRIVKSEGRTVKWNQLVNTNFPIVYSYDNTQGTAARYASLLYFYHNIPSGETHKLIFLYDITVGDNQTLTDTGTDFIYLYRNESGDTRVYFNSSLGRGRKIIKKYVSYTPNSYTLETQTLCSATFIGHIADFTINSLSVIDLTSIFGAGNEPATVEAFESWLAENMVEQDYYAYDAGSLVPVTVKGVKRDVGGTTVTNPMPVTTLKDENDVVMFPDGLKSAGSVKDEIDWEHGVAVKRVGVVDLGELTYMISSTDENGYVASLTTFKNVTSYALLINSVPNVLCTRYSAIDYSHLADKTITYRQAGTSQANAGIFIKDSSFAGYTTSQVAAALNGVLLYYELATPITYHFATHTELKKRIVKIGESVEVDGIEGETVVWNQIIQDGDFNDGSVWQVTASTTFTVSNNKATVSFVTNGRLRQILRVPLISDHKYLLSAFVTPSSKRTIDIEISYGWVKIKKSCEASVRTKVAGIVTAGTTYSYSMFQIYPELNSGESETIIVEYAQCIDLTLMFGSGNEPSTVAEFESWLSAHGGIRDYYPYCAGELKDKEEGNVRGVGFNLWDEEWEAGGINENGEKISAANRIRSKNAIMVFGGTTYAVTQLIYLAEFDSAMNLVKARYSTEFTFTTMASTQYILFMSKVNYGETYVNDICINLSDASRNGTYVPYKSITRSVDLTTLKGKVDGAGEDVVMFPDGMKQAGSVKDEIYVEGGVVKAVKRVGTVDLGELTWAYDANYATPIFLSGRATIGAAASNANQLCAIYKASDSFWHSSGNDMCVATGGSYLNISNSAYTSASDFKTAMQGVMLNYELASPVTYVVNMQGMEMAEVKKVMMGAQKVWEKSV